MEHLESINELWRELSGRDLTPLEWSFAEAYDLAQVPLEAVLEGMRRSFQRFHPSPGHPRIKSFMYCLPVIVDTATDPDFYWQARRSTPSPEEEREKGTDPETPSPSVPVAPRGTE